MSTTRRAINTRLREQRVRAPLRSGSAAGEGGLLWVDIDSTVRSQHAMLEKVFHFHPLAIEDTLNPGSRAKLEEYDGSLFVILRRMF